MQVNSSRAILRGQLDGSRKFVEFRLGDGEFKRAAGEGDWKIVVRLQRGCNTIWIRTVDTDTGKASKLVKLVVIRRR
jgi:hypothetical protein